MNSTRQPTPIIPKGQSGAAAVEFALVFPILFMLIYGMIVYAYLFVLQQSLVFAAQEAAEAVVQVDPREGTDEQRVQVAQQMAAHVLSWLPSSQRSRVLGDNNGSSVLVTMCPTLPPPCGPGAVANPCPPNTSAAVVCLRFDVANPRYLFPVISFVGIGAVPPMPAVLTAMAVARI